MSAPVVLEAGELSKSFRLAASLFGFRRHVASFAAVKGVTFSIRRGEVFGIVGESGSGKSTTARLLMRLIEPTSGTARLNGEDLLALTREDLRLRRREMQMVFQDPYASLNPRLRVGYQLAEPLVVHGLSSGAETHRRVTGLLERVGLNPNRARSYPHEFSGGERQRIAIARALAVEPDIIVADEAVSALDVSVRAQILNLLQEIKAQTQLSMVFISHDLSVVRHISDRVAVMYQGRIVEIGPTDAVFERPRHPYTLELLEAIPVPFAGARLRPRSSSTLGPEPQAGCRYAGRCALAVEICRQNEPPLAEVGPDRATACFRSGEISPPMIAYRGDDTARERLRRLQRHFHAMARRKTAA